MNNAKKTRRLNKATIATKNLDLQKLNQIDSIMRDLHDAAARIGGHKGIKFPFNNAEATLLREAATMYIQSINKALAIQNFVALNEKDIVG